MKHIEKNYTIFLKTLGPVHIGCDEKATSKEYIFEKNMYYFPEMKKLYRFLLEKDNHLLKDFECFMMENHSGKRSKRLRDFLVENNITSRDFGGYRIFATGYENVGKNKHPNLQSSDYINEVNLFIKDPYGNPYIPGSSLKGALRTVIEYSYAGRVSDLFKYIHIRDSEALSTKNLVLIQKTDWSKKKADIQPIPLHRECIMPNTLIKMDLKAIGEEAIRVVESMDVYTQRHYQKYFNYYLSEFPKMFQQSHTDCPLYLGGGVGLWTKANLNRAEEIRYQIATKSPKKMKMKDKGVLKLGRSLEKADNGPSNLKSYLLNHNNDFAAYEMGKCSFFIKERKIE